MEAIDWVVLLFVVCLIVVCLTPPSGPLVWAYHVDVHNKPKQGRQPSYWKHVAPGKVKVDKYTKFRQKMEKAVFFEDVYAVQTVWKEWLWEARGNPWETDAANEHKERAMKAIQEKASA